MMQEQKACNAWGMSEQQMQVYGLLSEVHQENLPWLFFNYEEDAQRMALKIRQDISVIQDGLGSGAHWQEYYRVFSENKKSINRASHKMFLADIGGMLFPFPCQALQRKQLHELIIRHIVNEAIPVCVYPWQQVDMLWMLKLDQPLEQAKIRHLLDDRARRAFLAELQVWQQAFVLIALSDLKWIAGWQIAKCAAIWESYLDEVVREKAIDGYMESPAYHGEWEDDQSIDFQDKLTPDLIKASTELKEKTCKPSTQENIDRWCEKVEKYYSPTGKYKFHGEICLKIAGEEGFKKSAAYIANKTRQVFQKLSGKIKHNT